MRYYAGAHNRRSEDLQSQGGLWLITFTDTIAVMLTFFVMTFAMSHVEEDVWSNVSQTFQDNFNRHFGAPLNRGDQDTISIDRINFNQALDLHYLEILLVEQLQDIPSLEGVELRKQDRALVLSIVQERIFEPGMTTLNDTGRAYLYALSEIVRRMKNRIEISVQADPAIADKWNEALGRAASLSAVLYDAGYTRPVAIRASIPESGSESRVGIVIMEDDGNRVTVFDIGQP